MKAWQITDSTNKEIKDLVLSEVSIPTIKENELLIKVHVVGLNPVDYRIIESGIDAWSYPHIIGIDVVGEVAQLGADTHGFSIGDRVFYHGDLRRNGSLADYTVTRYESVALLPDKLSDEQGAALLCSAMTAYQALYRKINLSNKKTILVHSGGGNVGFIGIQLAKSLGLKVLTTVSDRKRALAEQAGADVLIDYHNENVTKRVLEETHGLGVDISLNTVGHNEIASDLDRIAYNGQIVAVGDDIPNELDFDQKAATIARVALGGVYRSENPTEIQDLATIASELATMMLNGSLTVPIDKTFPFDEAPAALELVKNGSALGKINIRVN